jgi:hypothetical protein
MRQLIGSEGDFVTVMPGKRVTRQLMRFILDKSTKAAEI